VKSFVTKVLVAVLAILFKCSISIVFTSIANNPAGTLPSLKGQNASETQNYSALSTEKLYAKKCLSS